MRGLAKWILGPLCAASVGYFFLGPHYAGETKLVKLVQERKAAVEARTSVPPKPSPDLVPSTSDEPESRPSEAPPPHVSVGVKPVQADEPKPRRHRHHRAESSGEAPPEATRETDRSGPDPASTP